MADSIKVNEEIEVIGHPDVLVVGGGPAGVGAAFSAARLGLKVAVIEQMNCLGGIATSGLHGHLCLYSSWGKGEERVVGGVAHDFAERTVKEGFGAYNGASFDFEVEGFKLVLEKYAEELGIELFYYTQFSDTVVEDGKIKAVIIQSKSGRQALMPKIVIDCTGDADVAARSGVPFEFGRKEDGATQPMTLMFQIGDIDIDKVNQFRNIDYKKEYEADDHYQLREVWLTAQKNGDMRPFQNNLMGWWWTPTRPDQLGINFTHIVGRKTTDVKDLTFATIEGRKQAYETAEVYRKYIPGMENCWVSHCAANIGTRESRRIVGEYVITEDDLHAQKEFDDSIGYGSFFIDIHNCTGPGMDEETVRPPAGFKYQIPYRALVPKNIDNMFTAGRCISCTHTALGSLRVMPQCVLEGEAAGVGAYESINSSKKPADADVAAIQGQLRKQGAIITAGDIVRS